MRTIGRIVISLLFGAGGFFGSLFVGKEILHLNNENLLIGGIVVGALFFILSMALSRTRESDQRSGSPGSTKSSSNTLAWVGILLAIVGLGWAYFQIPEEKWCLKVEDYQTGRSGVTFDECHATRMVCDNIARQMNEGYSRARIQAGAWCVQYDCSPRWKCLGF